MILARKDISLGPTQSGFLFLGILIAMLLGSINYNNNAGFILVFLLGTMAAISLFHSYKNMVGLDIISMTVHPVFMGQTLIIPVRITGKNNSTTPGQAQGKALHLRFKNTSPLAFSGDGILNLSILAEKRGYLAPGPLILDSVYPFGLFRLRADIPLSTRGLVYPAPLVGDFPLALAGQGEDGKKQGRDTGPDDFQGLRPYLPGNPMGRISWKTFSRGQGLFIKDFTRDRGQDILMDLSLIQGKDLEKKLSLICRGIIEAEKGHRKYGIRLGSLSIVPDSGVKQFHRCLKALALYAPGGIPK